MVVVGVGRGRRTLTRPLLLCGPQDTAFSITVNESEKLTSVPSWTRLCCAAGALPLRRPRSPACPAMGEAMEPAGC